MPQISCWVAAVAGSGIVARFAAERVFSRLFARSPIPPPPLGEDDEYGGAWKRLETWFTDYGNRSARFLCQYNAVNECRYPTFGGGAWCRWHTIQRQFRRDWERLPNGKSQSLMFGAGTALVLTLIGLWKFSTTTEVVWVFLAVFAFGTVLLYLADGIMAIDYPHSHYAVWAQLLAAGFVVQIVAGGASVIYLLGDDQAARPVLRTVWHNDDWLTYAPLGLVALLSSFTLSRTKLFLDRILFRSFLWFDTAATAVTLTVTGWVSASVWDRIIPALSLDHIVPAGDAGRTHFWQSGLGEHYWLWLIGAWIVGFNLAEIINVRMRRFALTLEQFKETIAISLPICLSSPGFAIVSSRLVIGWLDRGGGVLFLLLTGVLTALICRLLTRWLILSRRSPSGPVAGPMSGLLSQRD